MAADFERALVTGGAGFIGHHLVKRLLAEGMEVTVLDNLSVGPRTNVAPEARLVVGDVRDPRAVEDALDGVDCVFHQAAIVSVRASHDEFVNDASVNLMGTLELLRGMSGRGVRHAVLASSMAVYPDRAQATPIGESDPTGPISAYGIAKLAAENYWRLLTTEAGITHTILRYFNTYGPGQTFTPYVGVITIFVNRLLRGEMPTVFGDGLQCRDYVAVQDVVEANCRALEDAAVDRTFNVGTGQGTTVQDIAAALIDRLAPGGVPLHASAQPGEVRNSIADRSAIGEALGFVPSVTAIDYDAVIAWWRAQRS